MASYSTSLRLTLIGTGEQQGIWGTTTNTNLGTLLEEAICGYASVAVVDSGTATALSALDGTSDEARNMVINLTGALTAARTVTCPAAEKLYIVKNSTTGGYAVTFKVTGQTGVSIPNGATMFVYVDGTDAGAVGGTIATGGTGATTAAGAATNLGLGTTDSPQFAGVNIGNASDTTITRSSAGVIAVEGGIVPLENRANTFSADQTISGGLTLSGTTTGSTILNISRYISGNVNSFGTLTTSQIRSDVTASASYYRSFLTTQAASFTLTNAYHYFADQSTIGAGSSITNQAGFVSSSSLVGATNNFGFYADNTAAVTTGKLAYGYYSAVNTATGGGTAYGFYAGGTARNVFMGGISIGTTGTGNATLYTTADLTGATTVSGISSAGTIQSDVTGTASGFISFLSAEVGASLNNIYAYNASFGSISEIPTTLVGYFASSSIGAGIFNYSFYASNLTTAPTGYNYYAAMNTSASQTLWGFYHAGTSWNYFGGPVALNEPLWVNCPAPTGKTTTATLTATEVRTQILVCSSTGPYTITLPTGTNLEAGFATMPSQATNCGFDWSVINNTTGTVTIAVNTGITASGTLTVAASNSARFRFRRTAANTFVLYRLA